MNKREREIIDRRLAEASSRVTLTDEKSVDELFKDYEKSRSLANVAEDDDYIKTYDNYRLTPGIVAVLSKKNDDNRPKNYEWIQSIEQDVIHDRYVHTGESLQFARDRTTINGQHRMAAFMLAWKIIDKITLQIGAGKDARKIIDSNVLLRKDSDQVVFDNLPTWITRGTLEIKRAVPLYALVQASAL